MMIILSQVLLYDTSFLIDEEPADGITNFLLFFASKDVPLLQTRCEIFNLSFYVFSLFLPHHKDND